MTLVTQLFAAALALVPFALPTVAVADPGQASAIREIEVVVEHGYTPSQLKVREGERVRLRFVRKENDDCTREVVIPALHLKRELPPNKPVVIDLPPQKAGDVEIRCGMDMPQATLHVERRP